ncbi:acyltransferase family protein [Streptosporangium lutulentum]
MLFLVGMVCLISGRLRAVAAYVLAAMAVVLLLFAGFVPWLGAAILSVMFAGTAIRRWEQGTGRLWPVAVATVLVALSPVWSIQAGWWWVQPGPWFITMALAGATFAGAMALRHRSMPRFLVWLGLVSYSVYLLHHPLLRLTYAVAGDVRAMQPVVQVMLSAGFIALVLGLSRFTYRYLELPMQRLGRRLAQPGLSAGDSAYRSGPVVGASTKRSFSSSEPTG